MDKIFIIGAGTMGAGIAQLFLMSGYHIVLYDVNEQYLKVGKEKIKNALNRMVEKGKLSENDHALMLEKFSTTVDLNEAVDCQLVIEAIVENLEIKKDVFAKLDKICNENTILATNTSSLSVTEIAKGLSKSEKVVGMHFFNPVHAMKLVEIVKGLPTSEDTVVKLENICETLQKTGIVVKEGPGFVVNRILVPMINEAIGILADGLTDERSIDTAMKFGSNHPMGPLELGDLIGLDVVLAVMEVLYDEFKDPKYRPHPLLVKYVRAGWLGRKSKRGFYHY